MTRFVAVVEHEAFAAFGQLGFIFLGEMFQRMPDFVVGHDAGKPAAAFDLPPEVHSLFVHGSRTVADDAHPLGQQTRPRVVPEKAQKRHSSSLFGGSGRPNLLALQTATALDLAPEIDALVVHEVPPASQTSASRRSSCKGERLEALPGRGSEGSIPARGRASYVVRAVA